MAAKNPFPLRTILPLALATALAIFAMGVIIPIIPHYIISLGGEEANAPYAFSVFSLAAFITSPLWGGLSDRYGRKRIMIISLMGTVVSYLLLGLASELWHVYAARILAGFSAGWMATSQAYIADTTSDDQRAKGMGLMGAAFGIGFTLGPALASILFLGTHKDDLLPQDFFFPAMISLGLSLSAVLLVMAAIREPERKTPALNAGAIPLSSKKFFAHWFNPILLKNPYILKLIALYFGVFLIFTAIEGVFGIWADAVLSYGPAEIGRILSYGGLITIFIQGGLVGRLSLKWGEALLVKLAIMALLLSLLAFCFTQDLLALLIAMSLLALAMGLHNPSMQSLISRAAPADQRGLVMGNAQSAMSFARILGPAWGAIAFGAFGAIAPYWIGLILIAFLIPIAHIWVLADKNK